MKRMTYFLSFFLAFIFLSTGISYGQDGNETRKEKQNLENLTLKKNKKQERAANNAILNAYYSKLLQKRNFVFTADYAVRRGYFWTMNGAVNFLSVKNDSVIFQWARPNMLGWNGVGGITSIGYVANYKFNPGTKKRPMVVTFDAQVRLYIQPKHFALFVGDNGTAQLVVYIVRGGIATLYGSITNPENARIFLGSSAF